MDDIELGASIAVNGCCLTVVDFGDRWWATEAVPETLARTTIGDLAVGAGVNLERPLRVDGRFGGHVVQGHVDGVAQVASIQQLTDGSHRVAIAVPEGLRRYVVEKGSVAVDGCSLTVAGLRPDGFEVAVIPHTWTATRFATCAIGDPVNIEVDVLAKYVERLLSARTDAATEGISND
jgi:riboflavin synthase